MCESYWGTTSTSAAGEYFCRAFAVRLVCVFELSVCLSVSLSVLFITLPFSTSQLQHRTLVRPHPQPPPPATATASASLLTLFWWITRLSSIVMVTTMRMMAMLHVGSLPVSIVRLRYQPFDKNNALRI